MSQINFTYIHTTLYSQLWIILSIILTYIGVVNGHGRLMEPPSRSSMWRLGYQTPHNYQDNELFCGGFQNQWGKNQGKCGPCGDPWQGPRENEAGGKYGLGIISRQYRTGSVIPVIVQITAPHKGWFEFRICRNNNIQKPVTQECLDKFLLKILNATDTRFQVTYSYPMDYNLLVKLPRYLQCEQCVFQWIYNAGNSWGEDENGVGCIGCGAQEQFRGCADVAIGDHYTAHDLIPEHKYIPKVKDITIIKADNAGDYIDYKDAWKNVKYNKKFRKKWLGKNNQINRMKNEEYSNDDNKAMILFETLFNSTTNPQLHLSLLYVTVILSVIMKRTN